MLYAGIFVYTLGEVVAVLGTNPYASRRIPASHRGRIGGIGNVLYSVFQTLNQYLISFVLMVAEGQYHLLWLIFMGIGLVDIVLYALVYPPGSAQLPQALRQGNFLSDNNIPPVQPESMHRGNCLFM